MADFEMLAIVNGDKDKKKIVRTNFWSLPSARKGEFFLSCHADAFRLLVPEAHRKAVSEFRTAGRIVITRGFAKAGINTADVVEVLFDDGSPAPFFIRFESDQAHGLPSDVIDGKAFDFSAWVRGSTTLPQCAYQSKCTYNVVADLPDVAML